jgi:hypothetical protein
MRIFRTLFVSLIAVGVCGVVYVGLTAGLAAYIRYKTGAFAATDAPVVATAAPVDAPAALTGGPSSKPWAAINPAGADAAALLGRTWTAPRAGLTTAPPFATKPDPGRATLVSFASRTWLPRAGEPARARLLPSAAAPLRARPAADVAMPPMFLALPVLAPSADIVLPARPAAKVDSPDPGQVRVSAIAVYRDGERPAPGDDPTAKADEQVLMAKFAPARTAPAPAEKLSIPDPSPNSPGDVRTAAPDPAAPAAPPDRPAQIKFKVK